MVAYTELQAGSAFPGDLESRIRRGEIFLARNFLQSIGLFDDIRATSIQAIRQVAGLTVADRLGQEGLEHIHRYADLPAIAEISNAIYALASNKVASWVAEIAPTLLAGSRNYYFEKSPNIRFITPYDFMAAGLESMQAFTRRHGGGKMTPHPPHRDSWVDCPANVINVWAAIGPIPRGNGLAIFPSVFGRDLGHAVAGYSGSLAYYENPGKPVLFDLEAGDALLFDGEHVHATVLNQLDTTRHVISFRLAASKPTYRGRHYHHYLHSALAGGPFSFLAEVPANLSWRWLTTRLAWIAEKAGLMKPPAMPQNWKLAGMEADGKTSFALSSLDVDALRPVTPEICVARIGQEKVVAFNRRCPHEGGDFAAGSILDGKIVCPWHCLAFDPDTGESACRSLRKLRFYPVRIENDTVSISPGGSAGP